MPLYYLSKSGLTELLKKLYDMGELFWADDSGEGKPRISRAEKEQIPDYRLPRFRAAESWKSLVLPPKQKVADYPGEAMKDLEVTPTRRVLFGLAQCDLAGIRIFDRVYREDPEFVDPFYVSRRDGLFIVTVDCSDTHDTCFCNLVKGKPYPDADQGFDLNLTPVEDGYLVESATDAGEEALKGTGASEATDSLISRREDLRKRMSKDLEVQNKPFETEAGFIKLVTENQEEPASYDHHGSTCVECGACTNVCPGCFCFGLIDNPKKEGYERHMTWDSCQFTGFARMAGELNPRQRIAQRFMHRYNHKFFHYPWRYDGVPSCTGCGRCISNCMGRIDMRATLRDIAVDEVSGMYPAPSPPPGEDPTGKKKEPVS